jgi:DNA polymerase-3 subunit alpha
MHKIMFEALKETHGAVVFQEQPLTILRLLGMSLVSISSAYKVLKDSGAGSAVRNADRLASLKDEFTVLCKKAGITEVEDAWHLVSGFMSYGFNQAHATGYGLRSYRCAYLKVHYPLEYMWALLNVWIGDKDKEKPYEREARRVGLTILPVNVNKSEAGWSIQKGRLRRGLVSVPGIGWGPAEELAEKAPFESIEDIIARCSTVVTGGKEWKTEGVLRGVLKALDDIGALEDLERNPPSQEAIQALYARRQQRRDTIARNKELRAKGLMK